MKSIYDVINKDTSYLLDELVFLTDGDRITVQEQLDLGIKDGKLEQQELEGNLYWCLNEKYTNIT